MKVVVCPSLTTANLILAPVAMLSFRQKNDFNKRFPMPVYFYVQKLYPKTPNLHWLFFFNSWVYFAYLKVLFFP